MNLYEDLKKLSNQEENFQTLLENRRVKIDYIQSNMPQAGQWYNQTHDEWVLLLEGEATLEYNSGDTEALKRGDILLIPAHKTHRVAYTKENTLWLAIHLL